MAGIPANLAAGTGPCGICRIVAERPAGVFTRQVFLGDTLDTAHIGAD